MTLNYWELILDHDHLSLKQISFKINKKIKSIVWYVSTNFHDVVQINKFTLCILRQGQNKNKKSALINIK